MEPKVGSSVHYQSYGTPGGEYLPEPRAAIVTQVTHRPKMTTWDQDEGTMVPVVESVGLCVLNPTGMFFNTEVPYADVPTPGHWNWPPGVRDAYQRQWQAVHHVDRMRNG